MGQVSLFDEAEIEADPEVAEPALEDVEKIIVKKYKGQRKDKLDKLPHHKVVFKLSDEDLNCPQCGTELKSIGEEFVRKRSRIYPGAAKGD